MRAVVVALVILAFAATTASPTRAAAWCGTDASAADRLPEAVGSNQIHVVYAYPSDGVDRFAALASAIVTDLSAIDVWWRSQDSSRTPRFDLFAFPNCPPGLERLDLSRIQLPRDSAFYAPLASRFPRLAIDLTSPPTAFGNSFKKYLVYYDGPVEEPAVCGQSPVLPEQGGRGAYSIVFLGSSCPQDLGTGTIQAAVVAHELTHNLGAVASGAPNPCPQDNGHTCDSERDLMFPFLRAGLPALVLDQGRDDYYGHAGAWWDVQDSEWLSRLDAPPLDLSVSLTGNGTGTVRSDRPGIACPPACSIPWDRGTSLTLSAEPGRASRFAGWGGACRGTEDCELAMNAARTVTARFARQAALRVQVVRRSGAAGSVTSTPAGIRCPSACASNFDAGVRIVLRARPGRGSRFAGWAGACRGAGRCSIRLEASRSVRAIFRRA